MNFMNDFWSSHYQQNKDFQLISSQEIDQFLQYQSTQNAKTCLDIGCGTGQLSRELYHRGYTVTGIDVSSEAIDRARRLTVVPKSSLSYQQLDIGTTDVSALQNAPYGLVTCKLVYAFMKNKPAFIKKMKTITAPAGLFVVITPLVDDLPPEKQNIGVTENDIQLIEHDFDKIAQYKNKGLIYFIGRPKNLHS